MVFLMFGIALRYWINRRKFNRRGMGGSEEFSSYEKATILRYAERFGKWIMDRLYFNSYRSALYMEIL